MIQQIVERLTQAAVRFHPTLFELLLQPALERTENRCAVLLVIGQTIGWAHRLLGQLFSKTNVTLAAEHFEKSIDVLGDIKADGELAHAYENYGRFHLERNENLLAKNYLTKALEIFERIKTLNKSEEIRNEISRLPDS